MPIASELGDAAFLETDMVTEEMRLEDIIQAIKPLHHWDKVHPDTMGKWSGYETYTKHKNLLRIMHFYDSIHIYLYDVEYNLILNKSFYPDTSSKDIIDYLTNLFEHPFEHQSSRSYQQSDWGITPPVGRRAKRDTK